MCLMCTCRSAVLQPGRVRDKRTDGRTWPLVPPPSAPLSFSHHFLKFPSCGLLNPALNSLRGDENCPQSYSGGGQGREQALGLLWVPGFTARLDAAQSLVSPWLAEKLEMTGAVHLSHAPWLLWATGPEPGPAHLHEVPMVFEDAAGRLPGVLVALPRVHPDDQKDKFPLVSILTLFAYRFLPKA